MLSLLDNNQGGFFYILASMKNIILFDDDQRDGLLPLSFTRPTALLRVGILTLSEKWSLRLNGQVSYKTEEYLSNKFPIHKEEDNYWINGRVLPTAVLVAQINELKTGQAIYHGEQLVASKGKAISDVNDKIPASEPCSWIARPHDIFSLNGQEIQLDYDLLTADKVSQEINTTNQVINQENIFLEEGAKVNCAILNASAGPIYIGKDAEIMEGSIIRGPFAMCNNAVLKLGTKIYGATTLGPHCKAGGELNNAVLTGYSSKAHDGFLGNSVLGEWCNLGADTNNSNLKNNYAEVKLWDYRTERFAKTGLQFCGLIMGDHSKCGINTMFNTGTVVGVNANIYGGGFPRNFIPSFAWGGSAGFMTYQFAKAKEVASKVMARRKIEFDAKEEAILNHIFSTTAQYRNWESKA